MLPAVAVNATGILQYNYQKFEIKWENNIYLKLLKYFTED